MLTFNTGRGEVAIEINYTFEVSNEVNAIAGTSQILNLIYFGPNASEDMAIVQGQLLTLFGEPAYITKDLENAYLYIIIATGDNGNTYILSAYSGPSGPAIGGDTSLDGIDEAADKLKEYILSAHPSDYEYEGYYFDGPTKIHRGVKDGKAFHQEWVISYEEAGIAYKELFSDN
ncbi:MAG: hypothetical protein FWH01_14320 [Oscillospiraceae bacterium]|nr:hypothetical protein [Oscillospiraceae bacterium]